MSNYIEKEVLIRKLNAWDSKAHGIPNYAWRVINELPTVSFPNREKGEWIPVSERLPEERRSVLVWCPRYKNIYCAYLEKEQWWIFGAFVQIVPNEVIAWTPLPEPYKAESEDKE